MADPAPIPLPGPRPRVSQTSPPRDAGDEQRPAKTTPPVTPSRPPDIGATAPPPDDTMVVTRGAALTFTIPGRPLPAGSKDRVPIIKAGSVVGHRIVETGNRQAKAAWRADIRHAATQAMNGQLPLEGPVAISLRFHLRRPVAHYGIGRNQDRLKPSAPPLPTTMPDALKLARAVEDALQGICYVNDAQIVDEHLSKRYGTPERTEIRLVRFDVFEPAA